MSLCTTRRTKSTRPAVIRPAPATFGVGVLDDEPVTSTATADVDVCKLTDAEFEVHLYGDLEAHNPKLANEVREAERAATKRHEARSNVSPSTLDSAYDLGYRLGRDGIEANPSIVYNPRERRAFADGHSQGLDEYHRDEIAATEAFCAQRDRWYEGSDMPWGDEAEYNLGSLVGHAD